MQMLTGMEGSKGSTVTHFPFLRASDATASALTDRRVAACLRVRYLPDSSLRRAPFLLCW